MPYKISGLCVLTVCLGALPLFCHSAFAAGGIVNMPPVNIRSNSVIMAQSEDVSNVEPAKDAASSTSGKVTAAHELEEEYGAPASQTVIDRGDQETLTRDSFGDGDVNVFYENKKDSRINDDDDAIGLEFRLFEFE